jgi:hypothetical protein
MYNTLAAVCIYYNRSMPCSDVTTSLCRSVAALLARLLSALSKGNIVNISGAAPLVLSSSQKPKDPVSSES